jgi:hypothetical protein
VVVNRALALDGYRWVFLRQLAVSKCEKFNKGVLGASDRDYSNFGEVGVSRA